MDSTNDHAPLEPRLPTTEDLLLLCRRLASPSRLPVPSFFGGPNKPTAIRTPSTALFWPASSNSVASGPE